VAYFSVNRINSFWKLLVIRQFHKPKPRLTAAALVQGKPGDVVLTVRGVALVPASGRPKVKESVPPDSVLLIILAHYIPDNCVPKFGMKIGRQVLRPNRHAGIV
jgi:hypothetical protein